MQARETPRKQHIAERWRQARLWKEIQTEDANSSAQPCEQLNVRYPQAFEFNLQLQT